MDDYIDIDRVEAHCEGCDCVIEYPEESVAWKGYGLCDKCLFEG